MVWLNLSTSHLFWQGKPPEPLESHHRPSLLAFPADPAEGVQAAYQRLRALIDQHAGEDPQQDSLAKVQDVLPPVRYKSFWNHGQQRDVIPVVAKRPFWVPEISDRLFFDHGFYTCEHDIPYVERAHADLVAEKDWWMWDTRGLPARLKVLTYDIETTQYGSAPARRDIPIDVIGYASFDVEYEAQRDLEREQFDFRFRDLPNDWSAPEVVQLVARDPDEELQNLLQFTQHVTRNDIVAGHNILAFDNKQIHDRIVSILRADERRQSLAPHERDWLREFTGVWSKPDSSFHFGSRQETVVWHPVSLDTFHAARKFYFFHDDFTLKGLAPWLGINVPERVYVDAHEMDLGPKTLLYNKHDVQEQVGITQLLLAQALPMAFVVNLPLEDLLVGGNTRMWDHMAFIRARARRKLMPATCRAAAIARGVQRVLPHKPFPTREEVAAAVRQLPPEERGNGANKELVRVAKQGPEMPFWCEHPSVIVRRGSTVDDPEDIASGAVAAAEEGGDGFGYAIPGGMTLKPDTELKSHFVPWYHVVAADVGAMYPTILKAQNLTADTVVPARAGEEPDDWIWLFELDAAFANSGKYVVRKADPQDPFTKGKGWLIGVRRNREPGMVNLAMTGILDTIQKVKRARSDAKRSNRPKDEVRILDMTYASLKAARNAGTHGILVAVNVSCRQFNVWGGANITTIGQRILHDALVDFEKDGIRVVYGDTDGIYLACSKSAGNLPHFAAALGADVEPEADKWITMPQKALEAVQAANRKFRDQLQYEGFELEAETHDCMVFVVHKNYLIFDARRDGSGLAMETKGNNFRGSDKPPLAQVVLRDIMQRALRDVASWKEEEKGRESMKAAIKRATKEVMLGQFVKDLAASAQQTGVIPDELILRQSVSPIKSYEPNPDGSLRSQAVRTAALEQVVGDAITSTRKFRFVVCRDPLPLYKDPTAEAEARARVARAGHRLVVKEPGRKGLKPIEYMWPVDKVTADKVDWVWYRQMVEDYVKGAFGFDSLEVATQRGLAQWM